MKKGLFALFIFLPVFAMAQDSTDLRSRGAANLAARRWAVGGLTLAGYGGSFLFLSQAWYKDYPRRSFHVLNDGGEWLQVDKVGHAWTTYHTSRLATGLWRWAGVSDKKAILYGTGSSLLYMLSIEYLDGQSVEWGWSWPDVASNFLGASLFAGQESAWRSQRIGLKFSAFNKTYAGPDLQQRADQLFGRSFQGRLLKDYNAQTYWLSANLHAFFPQSRLPQWLNLSIGYGANGLFGGYENRAKDKTGAVVFDRRDIPRRRQWYLAPDVDFTRIKTRSKLLKTLFSAANVLKFPAPALEFSGGKFRLRSLAY